MAEISKQKNNPTHPHKPDAELKNPEKESVPKKVLKQILINPMDIATALVVFSILPTAVFLKIKFITDRYELASDTERFSRILFRGQEILKLTEKEIRKRMNSGVALFPIEMEDCYRSFKDKETFERFKENLASLEEARDKNLAKLNKLKERSGANSAIFLLAAVWIATSSPGAFNPIGTILKTTMEKEIIPPIEIVGVTVTTENTAPTIMFKPTNEVIQHFTNGTINQFTSIFSQLKTGNSDQYKVGEINIPQAIDPKSIPKVPVVEFEGSDTNIKTLPQYFIKANPGNASDFEVNENGQIAYKYIESPLGGDYYVDFNNERLENKMVKISSLDKIDEQDLVKKIQYNEITPLSLEISPDGKYLLLPAYQEWSGDGISSRKFFGEYSINPQVLKLLQKNNISLIGSNFAIEIKPESRLEIQKILAGKQEVKKLEIIERRDYPEIELIDNSDSDFVLAVKKNTGSNLMTAKEFFVRSREIEPDRDSVSDISFHNWILDKCQKLKIAVKFEYDKSDNLFYHFETDKDRDEIKLEISYILEEILNKSSFNIDQSRVFATDINVHKTQDKFDELKTENPNIVTYNRNEGDVYVVGIGSGGIGSDVPSDRAVTKSININNSTVGIFPEDYKSFTLPNPQEKKPASTLTSQTLPPNHEVGHILEESITSQNALIKIRSWKERLERQKVYQSTDDRGEGGFWKGHFKDLAEVNTIVKEVTDYVGGGYYGHNPELNEKIKNAKNAGEIVDLIITAIENDEPITCQLAATLVQAIFEIVDLNSISVGGYLNKNQDKILSSEETHAFVVVQTMDSSGQTWITIAEGTPSEEKPKQTVKLEITKILAEDIPQLFEYWLETLMKNPDKLTAGIIGIILVLCFLIKIGKINPENISEELKEKIEKVEELVFQIQENQYVKEKYSIKNEIVKLEKNDQLLIFCLLEMIKFDTLKNINTNKSTEIAEIENSFARTNSEIKLGKGLPNIRQEKYQNQLIRSLLDEETPSPYNRKDKFENNYKLKELNQTLAKILKILQNPKTAEIFKAENPEKILIILESLRT